MHPSRWKVLGNISVRLKLMLGFALLVIMIVLVAYTGWKATEVLRERNDRIEGIAKLNTIIRDMKIERLLYFATATDTQAEKWSSALEKSEAQVRSIIPSSKFDVNRTLLTEVESLLKNYRDYYNQVVAAIRERESKRIGAISAAEAANSSLQSLTELANSELGSFATRQNLTSVLFAIQKMRLSFRTYAALPNKDSEEILRKTIIDTRALLRTLKGTELPDAAVEKLSIEIEDYDKNFQNLVVSQYKVDQAQVGIINSVTAIFNITEKMTSIQVDLKASDVVGVQQMLLMWLIIAVILSLLAAWAITGSIVLPLQETVAIADKVAQGDFTYNKIVGRKDELGTLQNSMQSMTLGLRNLIGEIRDGIVQVSSAAEELSAVTEQTSAAVNSQKVETDQIATAMQQMTATTHEVSRNAGLAAKTAVDTSQRAEQGEVSVGKAVTQIELLATEMETTKEAMASLRENAQSIGGVLDVINAVAEQTNLLALNAAIEAARAGEAGRGFAVVADEVRSLAIRTRTSTDEITQLITGLNRSTDRMTAVLQQSIQFTDNSVEYSREARTMLRNINDSVKNIESMNEQIACAAEQQSAVGDEINRGVTNVRDISDQTAAASEETASSSVELARISVQLQEMTNKFKI